jgi:anti-anti-sigma factor
MDRLAQLRLDTRDRIAVATVDGEIDLSNATGLEMAISESVPNQALGLVVDVAGVRYLDSSGIGLLFNLARRVSRRQQEFAVVAPSDAAVREILTLSGAQHALSLHDSLAEAVSELQGDVRSSDPNQAG